MSTLIFQLLWRAATKESVEASLRISLKRGESFYKRDAFSVRIEPFVSILIVFLNGAITATPVLANTAREVPYLDVLSCGPDSLYAYLIIEGVTNVSLADCKQIEVTSQGASLQDLADMAQRFGVDAAVYKYPSHEARVLPVPAIVQLNSSEISLARHHFCVVVSTGDVVSTIDSGSGNRVNYRRTVFENAWTGYAMIKKPSALLSFAGVFVRMLSAFTLAFGVGFAAYHFVLRIRRPGGVIDPS